MRGGGVSAIDTPGITLPAALQTKINEPKTPYIGPLSEEAMEDDHMQPLTLDDGHHHAGVTLLGVSACRPTGRPAMQASGTMCAPQSALGTDCASQRGQGEAA